MSISSTLQKAIKLLTEKGTEKELNALAKSLTPEDLKQLKSFYKSRFTKDVFHGTPEKKGFEAFDLARGASQEAEPIGASFVSPNREFAKNFTKFNGKLMQLKADVSNIFDYENPEHLKAIYEEVNKNPKLKQIAEELLDGEDTIVNGKKINPFMYLLRQGDWELLERPEVVKVIKNLGFDGMNVSESGIKNYAFFNPNVNLRNVDAKFDPLKKDTGNLASSIGLATGAGLAASSLMPEDSEAAVISKFSDVAKAMSPLVKKGEITKSDIMKTLGWSTRPKSEKEISEINNSALNLLNFAIMDKLGIPLDSRAGLYVDRYIKQFQPWLKGRERDLISGLYNRQEGLKAAKDRLISEFNFTPKKADKYIKKEYKDTGGFYSPGSLKTVRYELPYPNDRDIATWDIPTKHRIILLQPEFGPALLDHELNHYLNYLQDPINSLGLNTSYTFKHPTKSKNVIKDSNEYLNRLYSISDEENVDKLYSALRDKNLIDADVFSDNFNKPLKGKEKEFKDLVFSFVPKDRQLEFNFADHFLDYGNYEPERALEFLNNRIRMPRRNPSEGEHILRTMGNNPEESKINAELFETLKNDMQKIEVPIQNIDSMKQIYNNPVYVKPKILSNAENDRLRELEKKFGNADFDDFGDL